MKKDTNFKQIVFQIKYRSKPEISFLTAYVDIRCGTQHISQEWVDKKKDEIMSDLMRTDESIEWIA